MGTAAAADQRRLGFEEVRARVSAVHRNALPQTWGITEESIVRTGLDSLDAALSGGFPRGAIATLEGMPGSGRSAVAARLLAAATADGGLGALVEMTGDSEGTLYPPALAAAGVALERLLIVHPSDARKVARAVDIVLRSAAFGVVVMPTVALRAPVWTRLATLAHHANAVLVALGAEASQELRYFASLRIRFHTADVHFAGQSGLFATLAGIASEASVLKHKRAAPGRHAFFTCTTFESGAPLGALRQRKAPAFSDPILREVPG